MGSNKSAGGARRAGPGGGRGYVRIIGGDWRGRKLPVAVAPGLRPSGDRGRETLFNWLQPVIRGARCADLFAGTGVLGFEAASRGAAEVWLVENAAPIAKVLRESARLLNAEQAPTMPMTRSVRSSVHSKDRTPSSSRHIRVRVMFMGVFRSSWGECCRRERCRGEF
jgi:16S rRNA (guanine(966)-N(2))-methyltransferase RsmD